MICPLTPSAGPLFKIDFFLFLAVCLFLSEVFKQWFGRLGSYERHYLRSISCELTVPNVYTQTSVW